MPSIEQLNSPDDDEARALLSGCLSVPRWVDEVLAGRPYSSVEELLGAADFAARTLDADEVETALAGHPRIGERASSGHNMSASEHEQAGIDRRDADVSARLAAANAAYEQRFGRVFLVRAAGRSADDVLTELDRRLANDDTTEEREVVDNLREIALLRLEELVRPWRR
jgi:2-oxo-4-hydroxy-4-carboxy-5-ureidoimidazoline decarboxylase